jgi:hypothetical protein
MPRERPAYRDNLERLNEVFPNRDLLNAADLARFTGRDRRTVQKIFAFKNNYISKVEVARTIS